MIGLFDACTGCRACEQVCPKKCISFSYDGEGFIYPNVLEEKCIHCNQCDAVCHALKADKEELLYERKQRTAVYGWVPDGGLRAGSSSGGAFSSIVESFLDDGNDGIVIGAAFSEDFYMVSHHIYAKDNYAPLRKSKYVFSDPVDSYTKVKEALKEEKKVIFSGNPCQVAGLRAFLGKKGDDDNLLTVDFICHGTPSITLYQRHLQGVSQGNKIKRVDFRSKSFGWFQHCLLVEADGGVRYLEKSDDDWYMYHFLHNYSLRKCCYDCQYSNGNHVSDITIADFWGVKNYKPGINDEKGISLIVFNTDIGRSLQPQLEELMNLWPLEEKYFSYVYKTHSAYKKDSREQFFRTYEEQGYEYMAESKEHFCHEKVSTVAKVKRKAKGTLCAMKKQLTDLTRGGVLRDVSLAKYTTLKIGGVAKNLYFPETIEGLKEILGEFPGTPIIGGGSNLLINDEKEFEHVICLREFEKNIEYAEDGSTTAGSGVRLQKLITDINANGRGGIEYLYSVPGLVGGAIYMNAGRGKSFNQQISDYLLYVDILEDGAVERIGKEDCGFSYRHSAFHDRNAVIVSAKFLFEEMDPEEGKKRCKERMELVKQNQDNRYPNAGTTFCECNQKVMKFFQKTAGSKTSGVHFSDQKPNWLQNRGNGTFAEAEHLLQKVQQAHKIARKPCKLEYIVWK